jgi:hypothetical protein
MISFRRLERRTTGVPWTPATEGEIAGAAPLEPEALC